MSDCGPEVESYCFDKVSNCSDYMTDFTAVIKDCKNQNSLMAFWSLYLLTLVGVTIMGAREILQVIFSGRSYFRVWDNIVEALIILFTVLFLALSLIHMTLARHFATWSIFFGWLELTLLIGRFPSVGIYIYMSFRITKTLVHFILVFSPVLAAYTFAFYIIHPHAIVFDNPLTSFLKVVVMMAGEYDLEKFFIWNSVQRDRGFVTVQILFVLFVFFISIVLVNLLVGLTVSKTEELFREAGIYRLEKTVLQVEQTTSLLTLLIRCKIR
jgi:transient receptor potential cation channel subfamily A protein 1